MTTEVRDFYAGFSGIQLPNYWKDYELEEGLIFRPTYAHLMSTHTVAFKPPEAPGQHHPAPWKATSAYDAYDVLLELHIPATYKPPSGLTRHDVARVITIMMRLFCSPKIRYLLMSSHSLSAVATAEDHVHLVPFETQEQTILLELPLMDADSVANRLYWVRNHWEKAVHLMASHADFRLALEAFEMASFVPSHGLALVSLWGALEALFSPSASELRFRVSILIACYLRPPGQSRADLQKDIFDLYDKRSAAAHGKPKHNADHLMQTFNIVQEVLKTMIEEKEVPTKTALNCLLHGIR